MFVVKGMIKIVDVYLLTESFWTTSTGRIPDCSEP